MIVPGQFQQIGPPRNVSVRPTADGYVVTWQPPEFGRDELRAYRVRWTQASMEFFYGSAETQDTTFIGDPMFRSLYPLIIPPKKHMEVGPNNDALF
jgi:hypothetical protein